MELRRKHRVDGCGLEKVGRIVREDLGDLRAFGGACELAADLSNGGKDGVVAHGFLLQVVSS